jgi:hypothetical protein
VYPTLDEAAEELNITPLTLRRWLHEDAELQQLYREARREVMAHALARMQRITANAVTRLESILDDTDVPAAAAVSAAKAVIEIALKAVTLEDLEQRLSHVEAQIKQQKAARREGV